MEVEWARRKGLASSRANVLQAHFIEHRSIKNPLTIPLYIFVYKLYTYATIIRSHLKHDTQDNIYHVRQ